MNIRVFKIYLEVGCILHMFSCNVSLFVTTKPKDTKIIARPQILILFCAKPYLNQSPLYCPGLLPKTISWR